MPANSNSVGLRLLKRANHFSACFSFLSSSDFDAESKYTLYRAAVFFFFTGVTNTFEGVVGPTLLLLPAPRRVPVPRLLSTSSFSSSSRGGKSSASSSDTTLNLNCTKLVVGCGEINCLILAISNAFGSRLFLNLNVAIAFSRFRASRFLLNLQKYTSYVSALPPRDLRRSVVNIRRFQKSSSNCCVSSASCFANLRSTTLLGS
mmetsp:Transcript_1543/g.2475  ORF Transcript_1543/g.2475 Transcript_1543/m.2475 type:complete len:204 (+) Transcript_1543:738-1349(+)